MEMKQCTFGHFYDASLHRQCPYCGDRDAQAEPHILRREALGPEQAEPREAEIRPVVGWLVCVAGPNRGRSYELHDENNFVGRGDMMDVDIENDPGVSRDKPVIVTYDSRNRAFFCGLSGGREVIRLNGTPLLSTARLNAGDRIELSQTQLLFVPLCGEDFEWGEA